MHTIHHTDAIIIRSEHSGEANKRIWLLTKEFGLLIVMVQGVRKPEAKLQSQLSDYSVISADILKGKSTWRLLSARTAATPVQGRERSPLARAYVRTLGLLERFLMGEGTHPELFDHVIALGEAVREGQAEARIFDALSLWKVLVLLGYSAVEEGDSELFELPFAEAIALVDDARLKRIIKSATDAISSSHL